MTDEQLSPRPDREDAAQCLLATPWARLLARMVVGAMAIAATVWLGYEFWRLLADQKTGAIDLNLRYFEMSSLVTGGNIYRQMGSAVYPPASYLVLWPFLGWPSPQVARWLWALSTVLLLWWLARRLTEVAGAEGRLERAFVVLLPLSMYATGATIGNGQLTVHVIAALLAGLLLLRRGGAGRHAAAAAFMILALAKPTVTAPFFWIFVFAAGSVRPAVLTVLGYAGATLAVAVFLKENVITLLGEFATAAQHGIASGTAKGEAYTNQTSWSLNFGVEWLGNYTSVASLAFLGIWVYWRRHADLWLLIGVSALVARLWIYHRWYDDLLLLLPMITLFRQAKHAPTPRGALLPGVLLLATLATTIAPGGLYTLPPLLTQIYVSIQTLVWAAVLLYLALRALRA